MRGYDKDFLKGVTLPLPSFSPRLDGLVLRQDGLEENVLANYVNYSVVMNRVRRAPVFAALNIDQKLLKTTNRKSTWDMDSRVGDDFQLNNDYYVSNPWDKGHLAMRANAAWGANQTTAQRAADETFYYSNASLQHQNYNRDEWLGLEEWVGSLDEDSDGKITSFSGPVYGDFSRTVSPAGRQPAMVPSGFFKIVCFINGRTSNLDVRAFLMMQDSDALANRRGRRLMDLQNYQVTISEIEELTGLEFADEVYEANPLLSRRESAEGRGIAVRHMPERIEVDTPNEIIGANDTRDLIDDDDVDVFIAAAMVNPSGPEGEGEWVSIINLSSEDQDLTGWTLRDWAAGASVQEVLPIGMDETGQPRILSPGESVVMKPVLPLTLANGGGVIALYAPPVDGQPDRIDRVKYTREDTRQQDVPVVFIRKIEHPQPEEAPD